MTIQILDAMARGGFEALHALHDPRSGTRAFLAIHDTTAGPAFGGIRRFSYREEDDAVRDCMRLARSMTYKCALLGVPGGGGKMVLLDRNGMDREAVYRFIGNEVERLGGRWYTGPDVGTGEQELGWLAEHTRYVTRPDAEGPGELGEATARGVVAGMGAALRALDGEEDWEQRTIVVQGLGDVGRRVCRELRSRGAKVMASELDPGRAEDAERTLGVEIVDTSAEFDPECDIFAPCAMGGILHDLTLPRLRCRIVAGSANNVLASPHHGDGLHERGILYVPDFAINAGALVRGATFHRTGERVPMETIEDRIGSAVHGILESAVSEDRPPARVALEVAEARLDEIRTSANGGVH